MATRFPETSAAPAAAARTGNRENGPADRFGRTIDYLRVSLTDVCNLRCVYCMPESMTFRTPPELMQTGEVADLLRLFAETGFRKIRFTGGEPTLRPDLVSLVQTAAALDGVETVALTTNAILLDQLAAPLRQAGLQRVNVSLDTLDPQRYRTLTRWGNLRDVWKGLEAAERAGLQIKLNCVVVRGLNDGEDVADLARLTLERPWQVRFIEMMPFAELGSFQQSHVVRENTLRQAIADSVGPLTQPQGDRLDGEARVYSLPGAAGTLGFISSVTNPFCAGCNRARLTADGVLRLCLLREKEVDLLTPLRGGMVRPELERLIRDGIWDKPWGHGLADDEFAANRAMSQLGG